MRQMIRFIILFVIFVFGISVTVINAHPVQLNYYLDTIDLPLSLLMVLVLAVGTLLGIGAMLGMAIRYRSEARKMGKKVKLLEEEVSALRSLPVKEPA